MHDPEHERVLTAILSGDLPSDGAEAVRLRSECDACRRELLELQDLSVDLDAAGVAQRGILAGSRGRNAAHEAFARSVVQGEIDAAAALPRGVERRRRWWWLVALSVAAAAAVLLVMERPPEREAGRAEQSILLGEGLDCLAPLGAVEELEAFRWSAEGLPPGGHFELRIWGATPEGLEELRVSELDLHGTEWLRPPSMDLGIGRLRWSVELWDATGLVDASEAHAWLAPR